MIDSSFENLLVCPLCHSALNNNGIPTSECCCGHGEKEGFIFLQDGRVLRIEDGS